MTAQAKELENAIKKDMQSNELDKVNSSHGTFSLSKRSTWVYSDLVKEMEISIKETKADEQENGNATKKESDVLTFRGIK